MTMQITTDVNKGVFVKFCKNGNKYSIEYYDERTKECIQKEEFSEFNEAVKYHKKYIGRVNPNCYLCETNNSFYLYR